MTEVDKLNAKINCYNSVAKAYNENNKDNVRPTKYIEEAKELYKWVIDKE